MQEKAYFSHSPEGKHRIVYYEYGEGNPRTVICVHGLARFGRDFEYLAYDLAENGFRVIAPDMVGRGKSDRFDHGEHYNYDQYKIDISNLYNEINLEDDVYWIGTSMGGLLGMVMAAENAIPIKKLVINDIGPYVPVQGLERIKKYLLSRAEGYAGWDDFYSSLKRSMKPFGLKKEQDYSFLASISGYRHDDGRVTFNYDPSISNSITEANPLEAIEMWDDWSKVTCPTLIIHGEDSDILTKETLQKMMLKENSQSLSVKNTGHAPMLMEEEQIKAVREFLLA